MNLQRLIEQYIAYRRSLGECFRGSAAMLRAFARAQGSRTKIAGVRAKNVSAFLAGTGPITNTWHSKYYALLGFYRYAISRGYVAAAPLPTVLPKRLASFVPYIYTPEELRRLVHAATSYRGPRSCVEPVTIRTLLLLLYGTGLRISEALNLDRADVDFGNALLTIRRTKFYKSRLVPFSPQLGQALAQYAMRPAVPGPKVPFFTTKYGSRVVKDTFQSTFRRVCRQAGIQRLDGGRFQPRLHDLRHTFAVHRLTSWYRQGADVQKLLPQLSVYLGHVQLAGTQVYLSMTPELLAEANARFERYARGEGNHA